MSNLSVNTITDALGGSTASINGLTPQASNMQPFNRIINGAMTIDQRNAGAASTASGVLTTDRFEFNASQATKFTWGQNYGGVTPPAGFNNYLGFKTTTAVSIGASDYFFFGQKIEGFNFADLNWGTANAKTVTLSLWVYSSLTGTFGGSIENSAGNRSYPFSYTIFSANTWEQKSITIVGDTTGTWVGATNGIGAKIWLGLGVGSTYSGTAGAWAAADTFSTTGATSVVGTLNATFYITGVQLEAGSTASSFAHENYADTLQKCQRYFYNIATGNSKSIGMGSYETGSLLGTVVYLPVTMRAAPTLVQATGTGYYYIYRNSGYDQFNSFTIGNATQNTIRISNNSEVSGTAGQSGYISTDSASANLNANAEL
jgi:hypothetical protein